MKEAKQGLCRGLKIIEMQKGERKEGMPLWAYPLR